MLLDFLDVRSCYAICSLVLSLWWYVAWSSLPHATLLDLPCLMMLDVFFTTLFFLILSSCFLRCLIFSTSSHTACLWQNHVLLLGLLCIMLGYRILSLCCQATWSYLLHAALLHPPCLISDCLMSYTSGYAIWSVLHDARLLALLYLLFYLGVFDIRSLIFDSLILPWRCYTARPWLPHVVLPDAPYIRLCFLIWSAWLLDLLRLMLPLDLPCLSLRHVMLLDLLWIMLCYSIWSS